MSIDAALAGIKTRLLTITTPQTLTKVYDDPKESITLGEFPCAVLSLAPQVEHAWSTEAMGGGSGVARHDWTAAIYVFVGARTTPLPELHSRSIAWAQPIFVALVADLFEIAQVVVDPFQRRACFAQMAVSQHALFQRRLALVFQRFDRRVAGTQLRGQFAQARVELAALAAHALQSLAQGHNLGAL